MNNRSAIISAVGTVLIVSGIGTFSAVNQPARPAEASTPTTSQPVKPAPASTATTEDVQKGTSAPATTTAPAPVALPVAPVPVTVTTVQQLPVDNSLSVDCLYTYSDGTSYQWHWSVVNTNGTWIDDGPGQGGHWVAATQTTGSCDQSAVGNAKAS